MNMSIKNQYISMGLFAVGATVLSIVSIGIYKPAVAPEYRCEVQYHDTSLQEPLSLYGHLVDSRMTIENHGRRDVVEVQDAMGKQVAYSSYTGYYTFLKEECKLMSVSQIAESKW